MEMNIRDLCSDGLGTILGLVALDADDDLFGVCQDGQSQGPRGEARDDGDVSGDLLAREDEGRGGPWHVGEDGVVLGEEPGDDALRDEPRRHAPREAEPQRAEGHVGGGLEQGHARLHGAEASQGVGDADGQVEVDDGHLVAQRGVVGAPHGDGDPHQQVLLRAGEEAAGLQVQAEGDAQRGDEDVVDGAAHPVLQALDGGERDGGAPGDGLGEAREGGGEGGLVGEQDGEQRQEHAEEAPDEEQHAPRG